jgi:hypothetical protein
VTHPREDFDNQYAGYPDRISVTINGGPLDYTSFGVTRNPRSAMVSNGGR